MRREEVEDSPNMVTGIFSIQAQPIDVLFDSSVMHSFISVKLVETLGLVSFHRAPILFVIFSDRKTVKCDELCEDCHIQMYEHQFLANLYTVSYTHLTLPTKRIV